MEKVTSLFPGLEGGLWGGVCLPIVGIPPQQLLGRKVVCEAMAVQGCREHGPLI